MANVIAPTETLEQCPFGERIHEEPLVFFKRVRLQLQQQECFRSQAFSERRLGFEALCCLCEHRPARV